MATGQWIRTDKRLAIYLRDGMCCAYCGARVEDGAVLTLDHLLARELGGKNDETNLVTACLSCNSSKQDATIRVWFQTLRDRGVDTDKVGPRVRRLTKKSLKKYREQAKGMLAIRHTEES